MKEQPIRLIDRLLRLSTGDLEEAARRFSTEIAAGDHPLVIWTGMGASYFAAEYGALLSNRAGLGALAVPTDRILETPPDRWDSVGWVVISQSGESVEVVELLKHLRRPRFLGVLTNNPGSLLAERAHVSLLLDCGEEAGTATKTFTTTLMTIWVALGHSDASFQQQVRSVIDRRSELQRTFEAALEAEPPMEWVAAMAERTPVDIISSGLLEIAGNYGALALRETAHVPAAAYGLSEFRHGVIESVRPGSRVIALSAREPRLESVVDEVRGFGAKILRVPWSTEGIDGFGSAIGVIIASIYLQRFALATAVMKGLEPGALRMGKVVRGWSENAAGPGGMNH